MEPILVFIIGFIVGVICVGLAIELGMRKSSKSEPASRTTQQWTINEIKNPRIVAEYLGDMAIPENAKVVVNKYQNTTNLTDRNVRTHKGIKGNFILGDDRALILAGPLKPNEIGVWTVEKEILGKLNAYFEESWSKATKFEPEE